MPDYDAMSDAELRAFKSQKHAEQMAAREEMRAAGRALEAKRTASEEKWRKAAEAARDVFKLGNNDEHDAKARELFELPDDEMEEAIEVQAALGTLSREERRAAARAGSSKVIVPPAGADGRVEISTE